MAKKRTNPLTAKELQDLMNLSALENVPDLSNESIIYDETPVCGTISKSTEGDDVVAKGPSPPL